MRLMFTMVTVTATLLTSASLFAGLDEKIERNWDQSTGISKFYLGSSSGALNIGLSHERRQGSLGIDGVVLVSGENDTLGSGQKESQVILGTSLVHHLRDGSNADVYLGTGLAAIIHNDVNNTNDSETTYGPMLKLGSSYYFNSDWSLGLEYFKVFNWSEDTLPSDFSYGILGLGYTY